ncbi:MAG TPA: hypothetical protein VGM76_14315, partial [Lacipirellulaceae bacterium]
LESMEKLDSLNAAVKEAEKTVASGTQELEKTRHGVEDSAASLRADIGRLEAELATAETALQGEFKVNYDRVVRSKGAEGLAPVEDNVCGSCGQQITLNMQNELMLSKPIFCKSCGCLLYLAE